jgi:predicted acyltransferase
MAAGRGIRRQAGAIAVILAVDWLVFFLHQAPPPLFDYAAAGIPPDWHHFTGLFAHWNRYGNFAADFDRWLLNLFPRDAEFRFDHAGLATLNFVPSIATMVAGVIAGEFLRNDGRPTDKARALALGGLAALGCGLLLGMTVVPIVKAIWTPSWVLFSAGWALLLLLAAYYWLIDVRRCTAWALPLTVVGINSLAMYVMLHLTKSWIWATIGTHFGPLSWTAHTAIVWASLWLIAFWMYRRRIVVTV